MLLGPPRRVHRLADQERRVRAGPRAVLLRASAVDFGDVEVAGLIDGEPMHAPESPGEIAPGAPGVQEVAVQIVLQHLRCATIEGPQVPIGADDEQVDVRRRRAEAPLAEELPVLVEHLRAMVSPIGDPNIPGGR